MRFNIGSDASLRGPVWANAIENLVGPMFETYWELYALCISIGMMYDEQIESEEMVPADYSQEPKTVPRTVLLKSNNAALIEIMLQSALITTNHLDLTEDERLELAFGEDAEIDFKPIAFLTKFANAGVMKLAPLISDEITETMDSFTTFLQDLYEKGANVLSEPAELEDPDIEKIGIN